jgi:DUF2892 family protein
MRALTQVNWFAASGFGRFMASTAGRVFRIVAGLVLIAIGPLIIGGPTGYAVAVVGLVPLLAGLTDTCVISVIFGGPFSGAKIRAYHR